MLFSYQRVSPGRQAAIGRLTDAPCRSVSAHPTMGSRRAEESYRCELHRRRMSLTAGFHGCAGSHSGRLGTAPETGDLASRRSPRPRPTGRQSGFRPPELSIRSRPLSGKRRFSPYWLVEPGCVHIRKLWGRWLSRFRQRFGSQRSASRRRSMTGAPRRGGPGGRRFGPALVPDRPPGEGRSIRLVGRYGTHQ